MSDNPLRTINQKLDDLLSWTSRHDEHHKSMNEKLEEARHELFSNSTGLKPRLQDAEFRIAAVEKNCKEKIACSSWATTVRGIIEKVVAGGVLCFIAWLLFLYRAVQPAH